MPTGRESIVASVARDARSLPVVDASPVVEYIEVALIPVQRRERKPDAVIVVDLFRATSTIATLFARGLRQLTVAGDIELARALRDRSGAMLFGEVNGLPPGDFDYGNSPAEAETLSLAGRSAVMFTTNGTAALCSSPADARVFAGALANLTAVAAEAARYPAVEIVCAGNGRGDLFSLEDAFGAAAIVRALKGHSPTAELGDGAALVVGGVRGARAAAATRHSRHARRLAELGLTGDVEFALRRDTSAAVPMIVDRGEGWATLTDLAARP